MSAKFGMTRVTKLACLFRSMWWCKNIRNCEYLFGCESSVKMPDTEEKGLTRATDALRSPPQDSVIESLRHFLGLAYHRCS